MSARERLDAAQVEREDLADWRMLFDALHARFRTGGFGTGLALVQAIGAVAEEMDHHPDLDLRYPTLHVRLSSHDVSGVTSRDVGLARRISELALEAGVVADTAAPQVLEIALDTADAAAIKPFWRAVLGLADAAVHDELVDLGGTLPTLWFQQTGPSSPAGETPRQRFHLDIRVPPEQAEDRVRAAVEAGGRLVSDERAPAFWVLADPDGNRACVTTWQGRSGA